VKSNILSQEAEVWSQHFVVDYTLRRSKKGIDFLAGGLDVAHGCVDFGAITGRYERSFFNVWKSGESCQCMT
jgi:hypothetical protein